jgi:hypothetical protein
MGVMLIALVGSSSALAQSADPAPQDPYANPPGKDPVLSEQIAEQLVARAQDLLDAKVYVDAKQLAVEALVESPKGTASEHARFIIKQVNQQLGIKDDEPAPMPTPLPAVDTSPITDPTQQPLPPVQPPPAEGVTHHDGKVVGIIYGGFYGALVGATIGSYFSSSQPAAGAVPTGLAIGALGALAAPRLIDKWKLDEAQVRTVGAGSFWGASIGGLFAHVVTGANGGTVTASGILVGASVGSTLGLLGGAAFAKDHKFTRGDVALIDTLAGMGTAGGLTVGMLMQPAQKEAYSLNAVLGSAAGIVAGIVAAPQTNTTPRRMLRVAGLAAAGGAVPLAILAAGPSKSGVQRAAGGLSALGMLGGAVLGFYLTRHMDEGLDVPENKKDDAATPLPATAVPPAPALSSERIMSLPIAFGSF